MMSRSKSRGTRTPSYRHFTGILILFTVAITATWAARSRANAPAGRYTTGNGVVYDTKTKLAWEQVISSPPVSFDGAYSYCSMLKLDNAKWRVPSMKELQTIVDRTVFMPAIDQSENAFPNTPSAPFWTSSKVTKTPGDGWSVDFTQGYSIGILSSTTQLVRCVRDD